MTVIIVKPREFKTNIRLYSVLQ